MGCPDIPEIGLIEFADEILEKAVAQRVPLRSSIELTYRCNLKCVHCYIEGDSLQKELTYKDSAAFLTKSPMKDACGCLLLVESL